MRQHKSSVERKRNAKRREGDKFYGVGMAVATQKSGIPLVDMGGAHEDERGWLL